MGNLEKYKLNYDFSLNVYNRFSDIIKMKECYSNVAQLVLNHLEELEEELSDVIITYGAWEVLPNLYAKHCFLMMDDEIIDPTYFTVNEEYDNRNYLVFNTFDTNSYVNALVKCKGDTYLGKYNHKLYLEMYNEMKKENMMLIG